MSPARLNCLKSVAGRVLTEMTTTYFLTHPIQYQSPLLRALNEAGEDIRVLYATTSTSWDEEDGRKQVPLIWDVPLLDGYPHDTLDCHVPDANFWRQVRYFRHAIRRRLAHAPAEIAWVHGWGTPYAFAALLEARRTHTATFLRGETHLDCLRGPWWRKAAHRLLMSWLFQGIDGFLAIGSANQRFYKSYGVSDGKITLMPYVVDNMFFQRPVGGHPAGYPFGASSDRPVILYAGKLARHKAVDLLIQSTASASASLPPGLRPQLVIVGEGEQRANLEALANRLLPGDVWFAGFRNQTEMPAIYAIADIFVLPSSFEPWGLVVNEAMNAGKPVIVSDKVGARHDLVRPGKNGAVFASADGQALTKALLPYLANRQLRHEHGNSSLSIIGKWGIPEAVQGWQNAVRRFDGRRPDSIATDGLKIPRADSLPVRSTPKISVSYAYVHNAYQQAQAAADADRLERFYCSCVDARGHWGRWIGRMAGKGVMASRGGVSLPPDSVVENPWPLLRGRLRERLSGSRQHDWLAVSAEFDRSMAPKLEHDPCDILLCYETGAKHSFIKAREMGKRCLLDCPQFHPDFLWKLLAEAADRCDLPSPPPIDTPETAARKRDEFELAHHLLVYSPLHEESFVQAGFDRAQISIAPLWIDPNLWYPELRAAREGASPLRLLFVGGASLRKGIPFLLQAVEACGSKVHLTFAGEIDEAMKPLVAAHQHRCTFVGPQTKPALRAIYANHDLLVLPSIADAFGFVALEAMACGLPVLLSDRCGAPVPHNSWRIPSMDAEAIQARLEHYLHHPEDRESDGMVAQEFAASFTAEVFRGRMRDCFDKVMPPHS